MGQLLCVDTAYPPAPAQWLADIRDLGASASLIYTYGGFTNYTAAHLQAAGSNGITLIPIVVPGDTPPPASEVLQTALNYGFSSGPLLIDLESGSFPIQGWVQDFITQASAFQVLIYGTTDTLNRYSVPLLNSWVALWFASITPPPLGRHAGWQYCHDIKMGGASYDLSVYDPDRLEAPMDEATLKQWIRDVLNEGTGTGQPDWAGTVKDSLAEIQQNINLVNTALSDLTNDNGKLDALLKAVQGLALGSGVSSAALAASLRAQAHTLDGA
jgi:hypothetical protein